MKVVHDIEEEIEDQEEVYCQLYEKYLKDINMHEIKSDKHTYAKVYTHCVNSYFDFIEPELEKNVETWIDDYNLMENVRTCDILPLIFHHIDFHKQITKEYIIDNPECVQTYIHNQISNEQQPKTVLNNNVLKKKYDTSKKFDWSIRKYIE